MKVNTFQDQDLVGGKQSQEELKKEAQEAAVLPKTSLVRITGLNQRAENMMNLEECDFFY